MDSSIFRLSLDVHRQTTQVHLAVNKGDTARKIVAALSDGGRPYCIGEGCYAVFKGKKPDGNVLYNSCTIENNCIVYEFTEQTASSAGYMACELQLYGAEGQIITSPKLAIIVSGLVYDDSEVESSGEFTALAQAMTDLAELKKTGLRGDEGPMGPQGPQGPEGPQGQPVYVDIFKAGADGGYVADEGYEVIWQEYEAGKQIVCRIETEDQQWLMLPLVKEVAGTLEFGCICGDCYWQAVITQAEDGAAAVAVAIKPKADAPAATDELYFDITAEGVISLKPEYRGACPSAAANSEANRVKYAYAISDNDVDLPGTQNKELPEEIVIPDTVGGIAVTALGYGMFMCNRSIKRLVLPAGIREIPGFFCFEAVNLTEVAGTEGVEILNSNAFKKSGLRKAYFPDLLTLTGNAQFENCTNLAVANLGHVFENHGATIPKACFSLCEKLERLENAQGVGVIGENGMYGTYRLSGLPFLTQLAEIGNRGLYLSRADCDWENSIVSSYGEAATSHQLNTYDYTESNKVRVACSTPMRSTFEQHDPQWAGSAIGQANRVYSNGCMTVCAAMVYSALMGVELDSPEGFVEAVGKANPELLKVDIADGVIGTDPNGEKDTDFTELRQWLDAVGLHGEFYADASDENVKAMYTALAGKALVIARVAGGYAKSTGYGVHNVVFRGINANGELLVVDPSSAGRALGIYEAAVYAKPIQCMMRDENGAAATGDTLADGFVIVTKNKEE